MSHRRPSRVTTGAPLSLRFSMKPLKRNLFRLPRVAPERRRIHRHSDGRHASGARRNHRRRDPRRAPQTVCLGRGLKRWCRAASASPCIPAMAPRPMNRLGMLTGRCTRGCYYATDPNPQKSIGCVNRPAKFLILSRSHGASPPKPLIARTSERRRDCGVRSR